MKYNLKYFALTACLFFALTGCKKDDITQQHYDNKLYISASKLTDELLVKPTTTDAKRDIIFGIAQPETHDITVKIMAAPELLETYKAVYDNNVTLLDATHYSLPITETKIQAGSVKSTPITIEFAKISQLNRDTCYVLPVTIASVSCIDILQSARTVYYVFKGAALVNVVADLSNNKAWPELKNAAPLNGLSAFTLEALVNANAFKNQIATIMGIEGKFLVRAGDAGVPSNQIQIAAGRNLTSSSLQLETGRWYHIAVTFSSGNVKVYIDGVEKLSGYCGTTLVNFGVAHSDESGGKPRCFWIGYSYSDDRFWDGRISEVRIWNHALEAYQINEVAHFYGVDPKVYGLAAYWKFDEGTGNIVKDYSPYGNDLTVNKQPKWVKVSLPEQKK